MFVEIRGLLQKYLDLKELKAAEKRIHFALHAYQLTIILLSTHACGVLHIQQSP